MKVAELSAATECVELYLPRLGSILANFSGAAEPSIDVGCRDRNGTLWMNI